MTLPENIFAKDYLYKPLVERVKEVAPPISAFF